MARRSICTMCHLTSTHTCPARPAPPQPTVAALFRRAKQDLEVGGYRVKAGTKLFLCLHEVLRRDSRWAHLPDDSPLAWNKFSPERWLEGGGADSRAGGWVPFGAGPRMCVGYPLALAEIKVGGGGLGHGLA